MLAGSRMKGVNMHKIGEIIYGHKNFSIGTRLIVVFIFTLTIVLSVNMYMYININRTVSKIDNVYVSNVSLNELSTELETIQKSMYEYLNTKSSDALKSYYGSSSNYNLLINDLNDIPSDNNILLMEKNIKQMSFKYLETTNKTIQSKRGRNIERYKADYEKSSELYNYINNNLYSLNNEVFKKNANNYELLLVSLKYIETISTIILIIISLLSIAVIIIVTKSITKPLSKLAVAANEVAAGNFNIGLIEANYNDEIGVVAKAFNKMIINIRQYVIQVKENIEFESKVKETELLMKNHLKDVQLKYLQAQINPHFLFNTLNAGVQLAMLEEAERTGIFIEKTADFFRYNIKKINEDSSLAEEIELVDAYLYIMNVRFSNEINFVKEIDESLLGLRVPSMILQPIIENAVNYGIRGLEREGIIKLMLCQNESEILIIIKDNGCGMSQSAIDKVKKEDLKQEKIRKESIPKDSNGIGLRNVMSRLNIYYGKEECVDIISEGKGRGTKIILHIPVEELI